MEDLPNLGWANLQLDWQIPTHSCTVEELRGMTNAERMAISRELTNEGPRRWREAIRRRFPDATPQQTREIVIRIRLAECEAEGAIRAGGIRADRSASYDPL